jgi:DNA-binding CsgD family transcriptional regulator
MVTLLSNFMALDNNITELSHIKTNIMLGFPIDDLNDMKSSSLILRDLPFHFFCKNCEGKYIGCNDTCAKSIGYQRGEDMLGTTDFDHYPYQEASILRKNDLAVLNNGKIKFLAEKIILKNGQLYEIWSYRWPLFKKTTGIIGLIVIAFLLNKITILGSDKKPNTFSSCRQSECLYYLVKGMSAKRIAQTLNISPRTVEHHLEAMKAKLNCFSQEDLIAKAWSLPWMKERLVMEMQCSG